MPYITSDVSMKVRTLILDAFLNHTVTEVNISPKMNISAHTPKMALHENPAPPLVPG